MWEAAPIKKICGGPNVADYIWTEGVLKICFAPPHPNGISNGYMDGLSLHYYVIPGPEWNHKGSATDFNEADWYTTMAKAVYMKELLEHHGAIMDQYDPEKKIGTDEDAAVEMSFMELAPKEITAAILKAEMHAHNTFDAPEVVKEEVFSAYESKDGKISFTAPAGSVISFRIR